MPVVASAATVSAVLAERSAHVRPGAEPVPKALVGGCAGTGERVIGEGRQGIELAALPFYPQDVDHCGPAALATVLTWSGKPVTPEDLAPYLFLPERRGAVQAEMTARTRAHGRLAWSSQDDPGVVVRELEAGRPVLVLKNLGLGLWPAWHYAVAVGFDRRSNEILLRSGTDRLKRARAGTFEHTWGRSGFWALVVTEPGDMPVSARPHDYLRAAVDLEAAGTVGSEGIETVWRVAIRRWPEHPDFHLALSNTRRQAGDEAGAETTLREGLLALPRDPMLSYNLAWLLARRGATLEAITHARAARAGGGPFVERAEALLEYLAKPAAD
jgi:hypothetical protein